jgi:hypothetical protein
VNAAAVVDAEVVAAAVDEVAVEVVVAVHLPKEVTLQPRPRLKAVLIK